MRAKKRGRNGKFFSQRETCATVSTLTALTTLMMTRNADEQPNDSSFLLLSESLLYFYAFYALCYRFFEH